MITTLYLECGCSKLIKDLARKRAEINEEPSALLADLKTKRDENSALNCSKLVKDLKDKQVAIKEDLDISKLLLDLKEKLAEEEATA